MHRPAAVEQPVELALQTKFHFLFSIAVQFNAAIEAAIRMFFIHETTPPRFDMDLFGGTIRPLMNTRGDHHSVVRSMKHMEHTLKICFQA